MSNTAIKLVGLCAKSVSECAVIDPKLDALKRARIIFEVSNCDSGCSSIDALLLRYDRGEKVCGLDVVPLLSQASLTLDSICLEYLSSISMENIEELASYIYLRGYFINVSKVLNEFLKSLLDEAKL